MSIVSAIAAEYANEQKKVWVAALETAIAAKSWLLVLEVYDAIKKYEFSE